MGFLEKKLKVALLSTSGEGETGCVIGLKFYSLRVAHSLARELAKLEKRQLSRVPRRGVVAMTVMIVFQFYASCLLAQVTCGYVYIWEMISPGRVMCYD